MNTTNFRGDYQGKGNLDRPYVIFRELDIPTYILWDCDLKTDENQALSGSNLALSKLVKPELSFDQVQTDDIIGDCYACFKVNLEHKLKEEITHDVFNACLTEARVPFGIVPSKDTQKIPEVVFKTLTQAKEQGYESEMLKDIVRSIWRFFHDEEIPEVN